MKVSSPSPNIDRYEYDRSEQLLKQTVGRKNPFIYDVMGKSVDILCLIGHFVRLPRPPAAIRGQWIIDNVPNTDLTDDPTMIPTHPFMSPPSSSGKWRVYADGFSSFGPSAGRSNRVFAKEFAWPAVSV
jgi:hypothetical protein